MASRVSKVKGGAHGDEQASQRLASVPAMRLATARRDAALPPDWTRDNM
jgi:hypothetical protein